MRRCDVIGPARGPSAATRPTRLLPCAALIGALVSGRSRGPATGNTDTIRGESEIHETRSPGHDRFRRDLYNRLVEATKSTSTAVHRALAGWILEQESGSAASPEALQDAAESACEKLTQSFAPVVTGSGMDSVIGRALHLARPQFPLLEGVTARNMRTADGPCLQGLLSSLQGVDPAEAMKAIVAVLGNAVSLLSSFIGDALIFRRLGSTWPAIAFDEGSSPWERL